MDTQVTPQPDITDPLAYALRWSSYALDSPLAVIDADVASISQDDIDQILDLTELRLLETIHTKLLQYVDNSVGQYNESLSQHAAGLKERIATLNAKVASDYSLSGSLTTGRLILNFADHNDTLINE